MPLEKERRREITQYSIDPGKLLDVTMPLSNTTPAWPGDTRFRRETREEAGFRTSRIVMSCHSGTHMDAPAHLSRCSAAIDGIPASRLILPALVLDGTGCGEVGPGLLRGLELKGRAVLLKTVGGEEHSDIMEYGHLAAGTAQAAVEKGVYLVGIDSLSVDPPGGSASHGILLEAGVPVMENLVLREILPGEYLLLCFPLRIESGDGSPVRAFLHPL